MKKYVPSGYQIIDLGVIEDFESPISAETDDQKLLCELVNDLSQTKPILLKFNDSNYNVVALSTRYGNVLFISYYSSADGEIFHYAISASSNEITFTRVGN